MQKLKIIILLAAVLLPLGSLQARNPLKKAKKGVYIAGVAYSFTDSIVYLTDVYQLNNVLLKENGFLPRRSDYSAQLQDYIANTEHRGRFTCATLFETNAGKIAKRLAKIKKKMVKRKMRVLDVDRTAFKYQEVDDSSDYLTGTQGKAVASPQPSAKELKKQIKAAKKEQKKLLKEKEAKK